MNFACHAKRASGQGLQELHENLGILEYAV